MFNVFMSSTNRKLEIKSVGCCCLMEGWMVHGWRMVEKKGRNLLRRWLLDEKEARERDLEIYIIFAVNIFHSIVPSLLVLEYFLAVFTFQFPL